MTCLSESVYWEDIAYWLSRGSGSQGKREGAEENTLYNNIPTTRKRKRVDGNGGCRPEPRDPMIGGVYSLYFLVARGHLLHDH
jgi:hypothetical protein